jgi:hypothetical protein
MSVQLSQMEASRRRQRRRVRIVGEPAGAQVGVAYTYAPDVRGGTGPYTVTLEAGALPDGLSVVDSEITGTPTEAGAFPVWLEVADADSVTTFEYVEFAVAEA